MQMINGDAATGLSSDEARERLLRYGPNSLPPAKPPSLWDWVMELAREPVLILLLLAAIVYFLLGSLAEGVVLILFALFSISLMLIQEQRSSNALAALRRLATPVAAVRRNGQDIRLPSSELVPGDVVILNEGERVPADGVLIESVRLAVDESLLTGESLPVEKSEPAQPVYASTLVVSGHGLARLTATGAHTETGKLGASLATIEPEETHLQRTTGRLVRIFGVLALVVCSLLAIWFGVVANDWLRGILSGIALGMAMLPEEFPVALAIFLAIGSWRLAQIGVLVRRSAAVEALGAITCLCVDKTGTLTENRMRLRYLDDGATRLDLQASADPPPAFAPLLATAARASRRNGFDPMDLAVFTLVDNVLPDFAPDGSEPVREYALSSALLAVTQVWRDADGTLSVAAKGAPEAIAALCRLEEMQTAAIASRVGDMADQGFRVLAVAAANWDAGPLPDDPRAFPFTFLGLAAFEDPIRSSVPAAVADAHAAGIEVKMITGDFPGTARAIAADAGIPAGTVVTGDQLQAADAAQMREWVRTASIFARVRPEQKLKLVDALQENGETVAMTGDGVNDAPALKSADVGIAMGKRGTDVAREAADIVLLEEDFSRVTDAIRLGRRIFDNLRKVIIYIAAVHMPIAGLSFLPIAFGLPVAIWPLHVVVLEMVVDSMCSLAFEDTPAEPDIMRRPPRHRDESVAALPQLLFGLAQGGVVLVAAFGIYAGALGLGTEENVARTLTLLTAITGNLVLVLNNAAQHSVFERGFAFKVQPLFLPIAAITLLLFTLAVAIPPLRDIFQFGVPDLPQIGIAIAASIVAGIILELVKLLPPVRRIIGQTLLTHT